MRRNLGTDPCVQFVFEGDELMVDKETVRPIYTELQGYLSQAPDARDLPDIRPDNALWDQYNSTIDELNSISGSNYDRFKLVGRYVPTEAYRGKLSGLISRLYGEYFPKEQPPFSGMPSPVISQTQQQNQSFQVELLLQIQSKIDEQLSNLKPGDSKRSFLKKLKGALESVSDTAALIALILSTAKDSGITIDELLGLFR
jgi:hypothetical protein